MIDFGFAGLGDPASDLASISCSGEAFLRRILKTYPAVEGILERARFYRSTFALFEAFYGLRDGDWESFENGIAAFQ